MHLELIFTRVKEGSTFSLQYVGVGFSQDHRTGPSPCCCVNLAASWQICWRPMCGFTSGLSARKWRCLLISFRAAHEETRRRLLCLCSADLLVCFFVLTDFIFFSFFPPFLPRFVYRRWQDQQTETFLLLLSLTWVSALPSCLLVPARPPSAQLRRMLGAESILTGPERNSFWFFTWTAN